MSGWRAGLVAAAVGGLILLVGAIVHAVGGDDGPSASSTSTAPGEVTLACAPALQAVCADLGASLGVATRPFRPGADPGDDVLVLAPAADLPAGMTGQVVARSPVAIAVWRERAVILAAGCGGIDQPRLPGGGLREAMGGPGGELGVGGVQGGPRRSRSLGIRPGGLAPGGPQRRGPRRARDLPADQGE